MPVNKRPDTGAWEVTVCWGGRTIRRSSARWSRKQAREVERKLLEDAHATEIGGKPRRLLSEALTKWMTEYLPRLKSKNESGSQIKALMPHVLNRYLDELPAVAEDVKAAFKDLAPATVNRRLAILRRVGNLACEAWGWIDQPIGRRVKLLTESNQRHVYLTREQVEEIADACTNAHAADLVRFAAYTGIRYGHMLRLTSKDVRGESIVLDTSSKNGRPLVLPLHPRVQAIAERLPLPIMPLELRRQWEAARVRAKLSHVRWHDLRHTCASWLVQAGVPLLVVKELLGHTTIATTMRYAHLSHDNLRDAVRRIA